MKKIWILLLITTTLLLASSTEAHVLKQNGTIGAVIHVDPEDNPYAGKPSTISFEFKDTENKFKLSNCDCTVSFLKDEHELYSEKLTSNPTLSYSFPKYGAYEVRLSGQPNDNSFKEFTFEYEVQVRQEQTQNKSKINEIMLLIIPIIVALFFWKVRKWYNPKI